MNIAPCEPKPDLAGELSLFTYSSETPEGRREYIIAGTTLAAIGLLLVATGAFLLSTSNHEDTHRNSGLIGLSITCMAAGVLTPLCVHAIPRGRWTFSADGVTRETSFGWRYLIRWREIETVDWGGIQIRFARSGAPFWPLNSIALPLKHVPEDERDKLKKYIRSQLPTFDLSDSPSPKMSFARFAMLLSIGFGVGGGLIASTLLAAVVPKGYLPAVIYAGLGMFMAVAFCLAKTNRRRSERIPHGGKL